MRAGMVLSAMRVQEETPSDNPLSRLGERSRGMAAQTQPTVPVVD